MGEKFFEDLRRVLLSRTLPLIVLILLIAVLVHPPGVQVDPAVTVLSVCILVPLGFIGVRRGYKQLVATYRGFRLFVSPGRRPRSAAAASASGSSGNEGGPPSQALPSSSILTASTAPNSLIPGRWLDAVSDVCRDPS